ncbi:MAG: hypothetical protein KA144_12020 [Xanthomonadaceae bacterium]|nr:hypothetical protein [Xanthomonadaceae bacterium]
MLQRLFLLAFLIGGLALIVDYFAPPRRQMSAIESRSSWVDMEGEGVYRLTLSSGDLSQCDVDSDAYDALKVGDRVEISASHLFDSCTRVVRGEEVVYSTWAQPLVALVFGVFLFALGSMAILGAVFKRKSRH